MPKVSVIMPVYARTRYVEKAIESVLRQTHKDFELIVVSDPHPEVADYDFIDKYAERDKRVIHIHNETRLGVSASRNVGIKKAGGEFLALQDDDDVSAPRRFEIQMLYMDAYPEIGAFGIRPKVDGSKTWMVDNFSCPEMIKALVYFMVPLRNPTLFIRREWMSKHDILFDENLIDNEDTDLEQRMSLHFKMSNIQDSNLFTYRVHKNNGSLLANAQYDTLKTRMSLVDKHLRKTINLLLSEDELYTTRILDTFKEIDGDVLINRYKLFEATLMKIYERNASVSYCTIQGMSMALHHIWNKQIFILSRYFEGYGRLPQKVRQIYENSFLNRPIMDAIIRPSR
jgi:glycosyltransferase involved in cell wall biosynthesis